jgi:hypothetical protein
MRQKVIGLFAMGLAGCASTSADTPPELVTGTPGTPGTSACNAEPAQSFVGQSANQAVGAAILTASGARTLRWGPPNSAWTLDFREDRVNVQYDERLIIERITCG